jgi:tight adherence protein B
MQIIVLAAVFLATLGVIVGAYLFANRSALAEADAVRSRLHGDTLISGPQTILKDDAVSTVPFLDRLLKGRDVTGIIEVRLQRAGSVQKPGVFLLFSALLAVVGLALGARAGFLVSILLAAILGFIPWVWLGHVQRRRIAAFDAQLPEALDMMSNAMKAGYSFQAAAKFISEELGAPIGTEFGRFYDEQRLGIDVRNALGAMHERIDSLNLKMFVTAVLIQRETGGNLTELLGNLGTLMRDRVALRGQIETLAAEPKLSGRFLSLLPVLMFVSFSSLNPAFVTPFRSSTIGHYLLAGGAISCIIGYMMMMKMARIDT